MGLQLLSENQPISDRDATQRINNEVPPLPAQTLLLHNISGQLCFPFDFFSSIPPTLQVSDFLPHPLPSCVDSWTDRPLRIRPLCLLFGF